LPKVSIEPGDKSLEQRPAAGTPEFTPDEDLSQSRRAAVSPKQTMTINQSIHPGARQHSIAGFTLIELMITVAIIGILAMVAFPGYQSYVRKSMRATAQSHMLAIAAQQEQFLLDRKAYTATLGTGGVNIAVPAEIAARYTFAATVGTTPPSYSITATAIGAQAVDGDLTLTSTGAKTPADKWK
jgi:type IV pilus assembly protein PilE